MLTDEVEMFAIFSLRRPDILPVGEFGGHLLPRDLI